MKILSGLALALPLLLCACSQKVETAGAAPSSAVMAGSGTGARAGSSHDPAAPRYIATSHKLLFEAPEADLHKHFEAIQAACLKLACIILNANQNQSRGRQQADATLTARLPPQAFDGFLTTLQEHGKLLRHARESEDLSAEVVDVEARIANLTALRARILDLMAKRTGNMEELLKAEEQLAQTQTELDSIAGKRKALAGRTDMTRVELSLVAESLHAEESWAAPVAQAGKESGHVLMASLGTLITVTVALLPWLLVLIPLFLWLRKLYRARKARRAQAPA